AVGDFAAGEKAFLAVAALVTDSAAQAETHFNAYLAALEGRAWASAMKHLLQALRLGGKRLAPFPVGPLVPQKLLGADGFGVLFQCRRKADGQAVLVRALHDDLAGGADRLFAEAQVLGHLTGVPLLRIVECGFADAESAAHPYQVLEHFEGEPL